MKKFLLILTLTGFLFLPVFVFAITINPNSYTINSKVELVVSCVNIDNRYIYFFGEETVLGNACSLGYQEACVFNDGYPNPECSATYWESWELPVNFKLVEFNENLEENCDDFSYTECKNSESFEGETDFIIFGEEEEEEPEAKIFLIDTSSISGILAYTGELFSSMKYLLILIIGLPLAFWAVARLINLIKF